MYPLIVLIVANFAFRSKVRKSKGHVDPVSLVMIVCFWIVLNLPRVSYPLEWSTPGIVGVVGDDYHRLAELISMTLSDSFPLKHYLNQSYLFSFYYCAFIPFATLKIMLPVLTLKDVIFTGNLVYSWLILASLAEIAPLFVPSRMQLRVFLFLCTFFGGLDYIFYPILGVGHYEWWQAALFHGNTQVSSFYTGMFWTIHHFFSFYCLVLYFAVSRFFRFQKQSLKILVMLGLLASSFYSSVFAFFPALLFLPFEWRYLYSRIKRHKIASVLLIAFSLTPLSLFLGKFGSQTFFPSTFRIEFTGKFLVDKLLSLPVYLVFVPIIEYLGIPLLLLAMYRFFDRREKAYYCCAWLFFTMTYLVAYSGYNNFCTRGMLLPTFIFFVLFARHLQDMPRVIAAVFRERAIVYLAIFISAFGTLKEITFEAQKAIANYHNAFSPDRSSLYFHNLARDQTIQFNPVFTSAYPYALDFYYGEKMMSGVKVEDMQNIDRELIKQR